MVGVARFTFRMSLCCSGFAVGLVLAAAIHCPVGVARFWLRVDLSSFQFGGVGLPLRLWLALRPVQRYHYKNSFGSRTSFAVDFLNRSKTVQQ